MSANQVRFRIATMARVLDRRITGYEHLWMLKAHLDEEKDGALAGMQKVG